MRVCQIKGACLMCKIDYKIVMADPQFLLYKTDTLRVPALSTLGGTVIFDCNREKG